MISSAFACGEGRDKFLNMKRTIFLILILFVIPFVSSGDTANIFLAPSHFVADGVLKSLRPYFADFFISVASEETINVEVHTECFAEDSMEGKLCPDSEWFKVSPSKFKIGGQHKSFQEVKLKIQIPKNVPNGSYQTILIFTPENTAKIESGTKITAQVGAIIEFEQEGSINFLSQFFYWFKKNISSKAFAAISNTGFGLNTAFLVFGIAGLGLIGQKTYYYFKSRPRKSKIRKIGNRIDLRGVKPEKRN